MTNRRKTVKGTTDLCIGEILGVAANSARIIILARLLGVSDFGVAATFTLTIQILQTVSNMALNMLIVQSKDGDDPALQATSHSIQALRGFINSALILALAWPIVALFKLPDAKWAFQLLAISPLLEGFIHLDVSRMERQMHFRPGVNVSVIPRVVVALAAWPMTVWLKDYSAALWLIILQSAASVVLSHVYAERPYQLAWNKKFLAEILPFGWPLLFNGILFFTVSQGDRLVIGATYTMKDLGIYSVSAGLVMTLSASLFKIIQTLTLPPLSRAQDDGPQFLQRYSVCAISFAVIAALFGPVLIIGGELLVVFLYGEQYRAAGILVGWLAASQSVRILRLGPSLAAMAKGDTKTLMYANVARLSGVAAAAAAAYLHMNLVWVAVASMVGEVIAFPIPLWILSRRHNLPASVCLRPSVYCMVGMAASGLIIVAGAQNAVLLIAAVATLLAALALGLWGIFDFAGVRQRFGILSERFWPRSSVPMKEFAVESEVNQQ